MLTGLSLSTLVRLATGDLVHLFRSGKLSPETAWTALKGAAKYRAAVASGDVRGQQEAHGCALVCSRCPSLTTRPIEVAGFEGWVAGYCGPDFEDRTTAALPTCGCLTLLSVNGVIYPAGKTVCKKESCPQGRW